VPFFDYTSPDDLKLIVPKVVRESALVADLAARVEEEVLERFTRDTYQFDNPYPQRTAYTYYANSLAIGETVAYGPLRGAVKIGDFRFMLLRGYNADPAQCDALLARALKKEIADTLSWRIPRANRPQGVVATQSTKELQGATFSANASELFPPTFGQLVRHWQVSSAVRTVI
jgi:hypothetical protein